MRITIIAITAASLLAGPVYAAEFKPPRIVVTGSPANATSMDEALQAVIKKYREAGPTCIDAANKLARELPQLQADDPLTFADRQKRTYLFCMTEEFAADGLSVVEDVPTISGN